MTSNNALIPDPDKEDILASKPFDWPFLHLGLRMGGWNDTQTKYYLLGTPVIWWGASVSLIVALGALGVYVLRKQRKYIDMDPGKCAVVFLGSFLNSVRKPSGTISCTLGKLPSSVGAYIIVSTCIVDRNLLNNSRSSFHDHGPCNLRTPLRALSTSVAYAPLLTTFHRQLPTLYFSVLMFAHILDHFVFSSRRLVRKTKAIVFGVLASVVFGTFWWFRGLAFGIDGPIGDHKGLLWRRVRPLFLSRYV